jgi:hypothetical protein
MIYKKKHLEMKLLSTLGDSIITRDYVDTVLTVVWPIIEALQKDASKMRKEMEKGQ